MVNPLFNFISEPSMTWRNMEIFSVAQKINIASENCVHAIFYLSYISTSPTCLNNFSSSSGYVLKGRKRSENVRKMFGILMSWPMWSFNLFQQWPKMDAFIHVTSFTFRSSEIIFFINSIFSALLASSVKTLNSLKYL